MTNEETIIGNKLIAEFMGGKYDNDTSFPIHPNDIWLPFHGVVNYTTVESGMGRILKYHSSWDWLMPVVEKIENINIRNNGHDFPKIKLNGDHCEVFVYATYRGTSFYWRKWISIDGSAHNHSNQCDTKIEAIYKSVIEFIKWYNKNIK